MSAAALLGHAPNSIQGVVDPLFKVSGRSESTVSRHEELNADVPEQVPALNLMKTLQTPMSAASEKEPALSSSVGSFG